MKLKLYSSLYIKTAIKMIFCEIKHEIERIIISANKSKHHNKTCIN